MTTEMKRNASWINDAAGRVIRYVGTETAASGSYPINSNWQVQMADAAYLNALEARVEELEAALREIMLGTDDNGLGDSYSWEDCNRIARRVLDDA